jgi:cytochrome P450
VSAGLPTLRGRYPLELLVQLRKDPRRLVERLGALGDVAYVRLGPERIYLFNHPEAVREILVQKPRAFEKALLRRARPVLGNGLLLSEDDVHRRQRRLIQPAFHRDRLAGYGEDIVRRAQALVSTWRSGEPVDVWAQMMRHTTAVTSHLLVHDDLEDGGAIHRELAGLFHLFETLTHPLATLLLRLPTPKARRFHRSLAKLDALIAQLLERRRQEGGDRGDVLSMLLAAREPEGGGGMDDGQVRDELVTLFLAGLETTATALGWTFHLLAQHPEVEARLRQELREVLGERAPSSADYPRLGYTAMVFAEALRLYPPAWIHSRRAREPVQVLGHGVPQGAMVVYSPWLLHRDPRFFPEPERFEPLRFTPEAKAARPKHCYFPFGAGPRQCVGEGFAWLEGVLTLATVLQKVRLRAAPGAPLELQALVTLRPKAGLWMVAEPADGAAGSLPVQ